MRNIWLHLIAWLFGPVAEETPLIVLRRPLTGGSVRVDQPGDDTEQGWVDVVEWKRRGRKP